MKAAPGHVRISATDLSNHLVCPHITCFDLSVAIGDRPAPEVKAPDLWVLEELGREHEHAYLAHLETLGLEIVRLGELGDERQSYKATCDAMVRGAEVIAQATLAEGHWLGRADVLRRIDQPSQLGPWSYECYDCKLSRDTKAATILQLSVYSELLQSFQGTRPEWMHVVTPGRQFEPERYRVLNFAAYYRYVKKRLEQALGDETDTRAAYPEPGPQCPVCRWFAECDGLWRRDDHLCLVAGISRLQRKQLQAWGTTTVEQLANLAVPLAHRPKHGSDEGYVRIREQARVQVAGRLEGRPVYELLEVAEGRGLSRLPQPSAGDVFFDLEGDPFAAAGGREYLFGFLVEEEGGPVYSARWALSAQEEKDAFEWFVDSIMARWAQYPDMHVFHFTPYEPSALKRLMGRYATRENAIDRMLRAGLLIDVHAVAKQAIRASVEQYSLKALEPFHGFERNVPLQISRLAMRRLEHGLELGRITAVDAETRSTVEGYNADDCLSTRSLRKWLEAERTALERQGSMIARPAASDGAASETLEDRQQRVAELVRELIRDVPAEAENRNQEQAARWLLANLLDWHRREDKADCWDYFRLKELSEEDLVEEKSALSGLRFTARLAVDRKIPTDRYSFEKQDTDIRAGQTVCERGEKIGEIVAIDLAERTVDIRKMKKTAEVHPASVFVDARGPASGMVADALFRLGVWVKDNGVDADGSYRAARDLLLSKAPRFTGSASLSPVNGESILDAAKRLGSVLNSSVLAIQGPPGAGKTYTAARMICELVGQGKRVGVTAGSHKVIRNLLDEVIAAAAESGSKVQCLQKLSDKSDEDLPAGLAVTTDNAKVLEALNNGTAQVVGGTAWLWSREDVFGSVDILFIDEAGQMSLANALAVAQASNSLVLLGDPQQLEQPLRGSHPEGADRSALEHLLGEAKTIPDDKGLFLPTTWRLHPLICDFTSEVFYEGRLRARERLEQQRIEGHPVFSPAGLWFVPECHEGNQNASPEEVARVGSIYDSLLAGGVTWVDDKGNRRALGPDDILIVAPYNAQVSDLSARLRGARVGTVDKFQGQEAPIVIYSMTTSSPEDAPRGMEFLYSLNRLNVATSRARAVAIIVASPRLLEPECRSPRQMQLANALCRYAELAHKPGAAAGSGRV